MRIFGGEHDVGGFEVAVYDIVTMKFQRAFDYLMENLLDRELFLAHYDFIQVYCQPLHRHHRLLLVHKRLDHLHQVLSCQNLKDITLPDEADGQSDLIQ